MIHNYLALKPTELKNKKLNNRYVLAPMSRASATNDGTPTEQMAAHYGRYAKGGYALLIAEGAYTDANYAQAYANQPGMVTDAHQNAWQKVVRAAHAEGSKIILQLIHAGALSQAVNVAHAPSAVRPKGEMLQGYGHKQGEYDMPQALRQSDIKNIIFGFVQASLRAEEAGFDGVEIHCANGYLLDQFLTDYTNERDDEYGGSLENRLKLTCEIIDQAKKKTSEKFIIGVRLSQSKANNSEYFWPRGIEDAKIIFKAVADAGVDYIHFASEVKGYHYHSSTPDGVNLTKLAKDMTDLPIIANGGLENTELAETIIANGHADLIAIGKAAMVNYDLPNRIMQGEKLTEFTYDIFKYGVTIDGQYKWESENS
ncbi:MAG: NADH:flavin oxidoreductase [Hyphomicrobiales bacterium]